jgi:hypothetical protein
MHSHVLMRRSSTPEVCHSECQKECAKPSLELNTKELKGTFNEGDGVGVVMKIKSFKMDAGIIALIFASIMLKNMESIVHKQLVIKSNEEQKSNN